VTTSDADAAALQAVLGQVVALLERAGAVFAYLHGSHVSGSPGPGSDVDVAAWFGRPMDPWTVPAELPDEVDLLVLDTAPLELAGRVALHGRLLFQTDPAARVRWEATTRKIYLDEQPRLQQARRDFVEGRRRG
jgi:predicted nucleotidyltransferase